MTLVGWQADVVLELMACDLGKPYRARALPALGIRQSSRARSRVSQPPCLHGLDNEHIDCQQSVETV